MMGRVSTLIMILGLAAVTPALGADTRAREIRAELVGLSSARLARLDATIEAAIRNGATPGAALAIGRHGSIVRLRGYGRLTYAADAPAVSDSTLFDLASLTKVVGTTTAIMALVQQGRLDLDTPIHQYLSLWPSKGAHGRVTLRHLLTHTSGLPAGADLWTTAGRLAKISRIARMRLAAPPGTRTIYSDLGMIVSGAVVESVTGERLDDFLERTVFAPMRLRETLFNPAQHMVADRTLSSTRPIFAAGHDYSLFFEAFTLLARWAEREAAPVGVFARTEAAAPKRWLDESRIAPTEYDRDRGYALKGVVHDPNAASLDGVAGHAGLFSSARDLAVFAQLMLDAARHQIDPPFATAPTVDLFLTRSRRSRRALGWDMPSGKSSAGEYFAASSFGHTGFTGTSIWIDPERDLFVVLLTNRVYPTARNEKHLALRRAVHDEVQLAINDEPVVTRVALKR
jgi:CubicO group peptidase (beta-lactamase class C family)